MVLRRLHDSVKQNLHEVEVRRQATCDRIEQIVFVEQPLLYRKQEVVKIESRFYTMKTPQSY